MRAVKCIVPSIFGRQGDAYRTTHTVWTIAWLSPDWRCTCSCGSCSGWTSGWRAWCGGTSGRAWSRRRWGRGCVLTFPNPSNVVAANAMLAVYIILGMFGISWYRATLAFADTVEWLITWWLVDVSHSVITTQLSGTLTIWRIFAPNL